jgi:hypothetical protein
MPLIFVIRRLWDIQLTGKLPTLGGWFFIDKFEATVLK